VLDVPEYPERPVVTEETGNSTWNGQRDRFRFLKADDFQRDLDSRTDVRKLRVLP
jgi:hypothetical protein